MPVSPFNISLGPLQVTGYGIMMMVGFLVGGWLIGLELERRGLNRNYSSDIVMAALVGGVIGAKLWYVALTQDPGALFSRGGLVWYGGFLGGVAAVLANGWRLGVPARWTMQITAPALAAAYAIGRVGCFLVGDDYGGPTDLPWAIAFPEGLPPSTAGNLAAFGVTVPPGLDPSTVLAVHPTQLYETGLMLIAFMILWKLRSKDWGTGALLGVYLMMAGVERFFIEILRAKDDRFFGGFTAAQITSVLIVLAGVILFTRLRGAGEAPAGEYLSLPAPQSVK
ncbi:MAG: prolipoprotein diacylglyceryl transferase [Gemmatimonadales bacterium]|jgi:phosphatidylglycerol:prolipoprotein diacylglycerol transferase|nr:MAG: prolipoprotein diacylglyceryl transferase [Gemmatimonadales bacterium]